MMKICEFILLISLLIKFIDCEFNYSEFNYSPNDDLQIWFNQANYQHKMLSHYYELCKWEININSEKNLENDFNKMKIKWSDWKKEKCSESKNYLNQMTKDQKRMIFILCRGPNYSNTELKDVDNIVKNYMEKLMEIKFCLPSDADLCTNSSKINVDEHKIKNKIGSIGISSQPNLPYCLGFPDLPNGVTKKVVSSRSSCKFSDDLILKWSWESTRNTISQDMNFKKLFNLMNTGAFRNGYHNIGECWKEELEIYDLNNKIDRLWSTVKPFYQLLHGILRSALQKYYNEIQTVTRTGPLPAHFLGTLSSENWEVYLDLLLPNKNVDISKNFLKKNWTNIDMLKRSEDFYASLGLRRMTPNFWKKSNFSNTICEFENSKKFYNMFDDNDYRLNLCVDQSLNGFHQIVQQMGYIEYSMHFIDQPNIFQSPTNLAFYEAIGNVISLGIVTPQHLNRLTLLPDKFLYPNKLSTDDIHNSKLSYKFDNSSTPKILIENIKDDFSLHVIQLDKFKNSDEKNELQLNDFDISILLKMALNKIPKISFEYVIDKLRWNLFANKLTATKTNDYFGQLIHDEQGIFLPNQPNFVDHTAEFHITKNLPYVPYFLSSFLEVQIFKGLCEYTVFGKFNTGKKIPMPLHRCDIYGSKRAGRLLKKAMSLGSSVHWTEVLFILTGETEISSTALLEYYEPLIIWLENIVIKNDIPLGW